MALDDDVKSGLPDFGNIRKRMQAQRDEYIANLPYEEATVRDVIAALKESGYFYKGDFDPQTVNLGEILAPPTQRMGGVRIIGLTEGPGRHEPEHMFVHQQYDVPENEVFVTIDDTAPLAGRVATYRFERKDKGLKLKEMYTHVMS
jgi:hypothetical protein